MCGICGVFFQDRNRAANRESLAAMNRQILHRGPDDEGMFVQDNIGLAMRRLSIVDLNTGHQPISNEDETVWIVFNGEIYNHSSLRHDLESRGHRYRTQSDTESIVHLYEEYGRDCVQHLRGMFAFAIWDSRKRVLFIARDRLGIKPLYYRLDDGAFWFGSEIKTILASPGVKAEFNRSSLAEYLAFGYLSDEDTMYRGIRKLMPGHWLEIGEPGRLQISPYWEVPSGSPDQLSTSPRSFYVSRYRELLEQCVSSHLMSDVPLGVFLSGGLDSSAVAAITTRLRGGPIETFSVGYAEDAYSELPFARTVANHIQSRHSEVKVSCADFIRVLPRLIWHEDEPICWPSSVALYFVARLARQRVTVVLTGEGSDETLAGYTRYAWTLLNFDADRAYRALTPGFLRRAVRGGIERGVLPSALTRKLGHTFLGRDGASWASAYFDNFYAAFSASDQSALLTPQATSGDPYAASMKVWNGAAGDLLHRMLFADIKTYLVALLMKQDRMSMAASVESRVPFLDHHLVEFAMQIPARYSTSGLSGKMILKEAVEDLLPREIVHRKKMGFPTPWAQWLRGPLLDELEVLLTSRRALDRGMFLPEAVRRLFFEHRSGRRDHGDRIWRLLNLELWMRTCIEGDPSGDVALVAGCGAEA